MSGIVAVPCSEHGRFNSFWMCLSHLELPPGWAVLPERGSSVARNRNKLIEAALTTEVDYIFFVDDDQVFTPDTLKSLLKHNLPLVSALYSKRLYPNLPLIFDRFDPETGAVAYRDLKDGETGLIKVAATGAGGLLVRRDVLQRLSDYTNGRPFTLGQIVTDEWGDDLTFFKFCRDLGIEILVDLDTCMGHSGEMTIWPRLAGGKWVTILNNNGLMLQLPKVVFDEDAAVKRLAKV